jgi:hypothetical protein
MEYILLEISHEQMGRFEGVVWYGFVDVCSEVVFEYFHTRLTAIVNYFFFKKNTKIKKHQKWREFLLKSVSTLAPRAYFVSQSRA